MPTGHHLRITLMKGLFLFTFKEKMPLTISDFMTPNVYLGFKESKLPDSLHGAGGGKSD